MPYMYELIIFFLNRICPDERTNAVDGQLENVKT